MKRFKIAKVLSLVLSAVFAITVFTTNASAASRADEYRRDLTAEEIQCIYSMFDAEYYAKAYADVVDTLGTSDANVLFAHFLNFGLWEERQPSALFNVDVYATRNIDLRAAYGDDIVAYYVHYATHPEEIVWRVTPTLSDSYRNGVTIYSVYDMVLGSQYDVKEGAWPVQTATYAPELAMSDNELITYLNDNGLLDEYLASVGQ